MMMNFVALSLLFSTLAAAGIFSPRTAEPKLYQQNQPQQQELHQNDPVVRGGHRIFVIEYERQFGEQAPHRRPSLANELVEEAKEKFQEAASLLPNVGQGASMPAPAELEDQPKASHSVKNVICDAYGVCKETISSLVGKGKEKTAEVQEGAKDAARKVAEKAGEVKEAAKDVSEDGKEKAAELMEGTKDAVKGGARKAGEVKEAAKDAVTGAVGKASEVKEEAKDYVKEKASNKIENVKEKAREVKDEAKDAMGRAVGAAKQKGEEISGGVSSMAENAKQKKEEVRRNLTDILHRARDVAYDSAAYAWASEIGRGAAAIAHLVGLATAYGTCVWVTFVSSHVLAMALPRQQFGAVQSKLYPVYFRAVGYGISLAILGQFFGRGRRADAGGEKVQGYNLLGAMVLVLINMLYLEPKATKVMYERLKMEKEEGRGRDMADYGAAATPVPDVFVRKTAVGEGKKAAEAQVPENSMVMLSKKLKMLNNYSSMVNVLSLMSLTWHLVHLSQSLVCNA